MNSVAARTSARPLYEVFLERVIQIEAVQCYRAAVTDDHTAQFFAEGRRPGAVRRLPVVPGRAGGVSPGRLSWSRSTRS